TVYVGDWSGRFYAIDRRDGSKRWVVKTKPHPRVYAGQIVSSAAGRDRAEPEVAPAEPEAPVEPAPLVKEADPEFEKLLAQEEEIERATREHHETPHFRPGDAD
ncbi:MAG: hypothetical protein ACERLM_07970, partial [Acidimicrobiales bacterium]